MHNFAMNKFQEVCVSIRLWYSSLRLWLNPTNALHTSSTKLNPCLNFSYSKSVHSSIAIFISKVLEHWESLLPFTCIVVKMIYFLVPYIYLTFENDNKMSLSISKMHNYINRIHQTLQVITSNLMGHVDAPIGKTNNQLVLIYTTMKHENIVHILTSGNPQWFKKWNFLIMIDSWKCSFYLCKFDMEHPKMVKWKNWQHV